MKQRTRLLKILMLVLCALAAPISLRAAFFAGGLVNSQFVTSFGSGLVTGAPDAGGLFLGDTFDPPAHPGFITVSFSTPLFDGPGIDLRVYDVANSVDETAAISVSADGVTFTPVGSLNAVANTLDIGGLFAGPFQFVKIQNSSTLVSIDVDAVEGLNVVPEPSTVSLMAIGALALRLKRWRKSAA